MNDSRIEKAHHFDELAGTTTPPVLRFAALLLGLGVAILVSAQALFGTGVWLATGLSIAVFVLIAVLAVQAMQVSYESQNLGLCNVVTASRSAIVALLAGVCARPDLVHSHGWLLMALAITVLVMDGLDGWLARYFETASAFGARFDMEIDALLGAVLALILLVSGKAGAEILALGFMRYAFVLAGLVLPWLRAPLPESFRRKLICVLQIMALIALLSPVVPGPLAVVISSVAAGLLTWSFLVDTCWLARQTR